MESLPASFVPPLFAEHAGQEFRIVVDDCVGCFLYISQDGTLINSDLCAVADRMNKSSGKEKFGGEVEKGSELESILGELLDESLAAERTTQWRKVVANAELQLSPYTVFTVEKSGEARLYAMVRAERPVADRDAKSSWSGRYFARAPGIYKLDDTGWMAEGRFAGAMHLALARALEVCIDDTHGRLTGSATAKAKGRYPYLNKDFELPAIIVQDHPDSVVAKLVVGDVMVLAGTHVLDRSDYEIKAATVKDPRK